MAPNAPPNFGKRGMNVGRSSAPIPPPPPAAPRRLRSQTVVIGALGALMLGGVAYAEWRRDQCKPPQNVQQDPNGTWVRPAWCDHSYSSGHSYGTGHGFYAGGGSYGGGGSYAGGAANGHASFGGFGSHGAGHGSGA